MKTPPDRVAAIRSLWKYAHDEVREYFAVEDDGSFELDAMMMKGMRSEGPRRKPFKKSPI
jgi:hypothetical protein